jgi:hypothetical protein
MQDLPARQNTVSFYTTAMSVFAVAVKPLQQTLMNEGVLKK